MRFDIATAFLRSRRGHVHWVELLSEVHAESVAARETESRLKLIRTPGATQGKLRRHRLTGRHVVFWLQQVERHVDLATRDSEVREARQIRLRGWEIVFAVRVHRNTERRGDTAVVEGPAITLHARRADCVKDDWASGRRRIRNVVGS